MFGSDGQAKPGLPHFADESFAIPLPFFFDFFAAEVKFWSAMAMMRVGDKTRSMEVTKNARQPRGICH